MTSYDLLGPPWDLPGTSWDLLESYESPNQAKSNQNQIEIKSLIKILIEVLGNPLITE